MAFLSKIQRTEIFTSLRNIGIKKIIIFLLILLSTAGCTSTSLLSSRITRTLVPTGIKYVFPATWTQPPPTNPSIPTGTPSPTTSPTITPTITQTDTNTSVSTSSTEMDEEPSSTPDWGSAQRLDCTFTASDTGVRIYSAPFIDPYRVLPTMEPGKPYPAVITKPTYTLLLENGEPLGWIDYRSLAVNHDGKECLTEQDQREITDFHPYAF